MHLTYAFLGVLAGAGLTVQALINGRLGSHIGGPVWATAVSFFIGGCGLILYQLLQRAPVPATAQFGAAPAWAFVGGLIGAFYLATATVGVPKLGATVLFSLVIFGQLAGALVLDHFGVMGVSEHPVSWPRLLGVVLVFGGAILVLRH